MNNTNTHQIPEVIITRPPDQIPLPPPPFPPPAYDIQTQIWLAYNSGYNAGFTMGFNKANSIKRNKMNRRKRKPNMTWKRRKDDDGEMQLEFKSDAVNVPNHLKTK